MRHHSRRKRHSHLCGRLQWETKNVENFGMHYMYGQANGNSTDALQMYHAQFPVRRMLDHRIFQRLYPQLRETFSFQVIRHDVG
ncbi:hypothetical protein TNCV_4796021 [Trichonephila clavipes]|nr:hypothetical protein TNCV_4796021 [Trichonephila clavipes]